MNQEKIEYIFNKAEEEGVDTGDMVAMVEFAFNLTASEGEITSYLATKRDEAKQKQINKARELLEKENYSVSKI